MRESLVTALVGHVPRVFRKKNRREVLILGVSVTSFLAGLVTAHRGEGVGACRWVLGRRRSQGWGSMVLPAGEAAAVMPVFKVWASEPGVWSFPSLGSTEHLALVTAEGCFGSPDAEKYRKPGWENQRV